MSVLGLMVVFVFEFVLVVVLHEFVDAVRRLVCRANFAWVDFVFTACNSKL